MVIGGTGVLGGSLSESPASAGASVTILGRNQERVKRIHEAGEKAVFFPVGATDRGSLKSAHRSIHEALGALTVLVNATGGNDLRVTVTAERPCEGNEADDWRANFGLNLVGGVVLPCQEFGSAMAARQKGSIINIASVSVGRGSLSQTI